MKFGTGTATGEPDALPSPADHPSLPDEYKKKEVEDKKDDDDDDEEESK